MPGRLLQLMQSLEPLTALLHPCRGGQVVSLRQEDSGQGGIWLGMRARELGLWQRLVFKNPLMHPFALYVAAAKGVERVDDKTLAATADLVAAAKKLEELSPTLRMMVHMSGVDSSDAVTFASIGGTDRAVDSDVLRVMSRVHQFVRGRESLRGVTLPVGGRPAQLVDDDSQGYGTLPADMTLKDCVDLMTSAADDFLPPPLSVQRMARRLSRTAAGLPPVSPSSESDSSGSEELPNTAFTLESAEGAGPHTPSQQAFNFTNSLLYINERR